MWMPVTDTTKPNEILGNHVLLSTSSTSAAASTVPNTSSVAATSNAGYKEKYGSMKLKLKDILYENELFQDELKTLKRELLDIYRDKDSLLQKVLQFEGSLGSSDESDSDNPSEHVIQNQASVPVDSLRNNDDGCIGPEIVIGPKIDGDSNNNKKICINLKPTPPKPEITNVKSNPKPKTTASRGRKTISTAANSTKVNNDSNNGTKDIALPNNKAPAKRATNTKNNNFEGANEPKPPPVKKERKKPQPKQTKQPVLKQQQQVQQQKLQVQQKQPQLTPSPQSVTIVHQMNQQQQQQQQQQLQIIQQQAQSQGHSQQFKMEVQQPQQQGITVIGQMPTPDDQIKYIQHVNLPVQNLENNSMIVSNNANQIQIQPQQQHQNHIMTQHTHQIHFQLPQTTLAPVIEAFQTPQSIITTQGNQINFGGQSYTIVTSTNDGTSNLMQHGQSQAQQQLNHNSSPSDQRQMMTQIVPMNSIVQQDINSISPQTVQDHSPENQQQSQLQHQQSHDNSQYQHPVIQYQSSHMLPISVNHQQSQQTHDEQICSDVVDFEQHLESRRMEQTASLIPDWETSDIFSSDPIKFMVED